MKRGRKSNIEKELEIENEFLIDDIDQDFEIEDFDPEETEEIEIGKQPMFDLEDYE
jgi:hypothetical protein